MDAAACLNSSSDPFLYTSLNEFSKGRSLLIWSFSAPVENRSVSRPTRKRMKTLVVNPVAWCALAAWASAGFAEENESADSALIEPTEFETAPAAMHRGSVDVLSVAVPRQGEQVFAALYDGSVMTLDRTSRKAIRLVKGHEGPVSGLAVSRSGKLFVTCGHDGTIRVWKLPKFELMRTMSGHSGRVIDVAISPDGRTIASCGYDGTVRIGRVDSKTERGRLTAHNGTVRAVAFSPDGTTLASAGDDGTVRLWNVEKLNETGTRSGHKGRVRDVVFSPDGKTLASVGEDGTVLLWSVADADKPPTKLTHGSMIWTVAFSPRGSLLATGDADGTIHVWDIETERIASSLEGHEDAITSLSFTSDSKTLYSSSHDGTVNAWNAKQPPHPALATIPVEAGKVWATAVSPATSRIAVGGRRGFVRILDLSTGKQVSELEGHPATVDCLEFSRDGRLIAQADGEAKKSSCGGPMTERSRNRSRRTGISARSRSRRTALGSRPDAKTNCWSSGTSNPAS